MSSSFHSFSSFLFPCRGIVSPVFLVPFQSLSFLFFFLLILMIFFSCFFSLVRFSFGSLFQGLQRPVTVPKCSFLSVDCLPFLASPLPLPVWGLPCSFSSCLPPPLFVPCFSGLATLSLLLFHCFLHFKFPFLTLFLFIFLLKILPFCFRF